MRLRDHPAFRALAWILPAVFFIGLISMPREEYIGDPMYIRCATVNLINHGTIEIPKEIVIGYGAERGQYFFENPINHKWYSKYGVMNELMNVPPLLVEKWWNGNLPYVSFSRVIFLNCFNLILSLASAFYLSQIAAKYTRSSWVIVIFVLTAFYGTYWWNYLRAQNSEIYQTLFMLAFYYHVTSYFRPSALERHEAGWRGSKRHLLLAGIFFGSLILVKTVYVILVPVVLLWTGFREAAQFRSGSAMGPGQICRALLQSTGWLLVPILCALLALLALNAYKFGSPLETGYGQWGEQNKPIFSGNFAEGLYKLLLDVQGSIFLYFPILLFALLGYRTFYKKYPADVVLFLTSAVALLLLEAKFLNPLGAWGYGPRYMLVVLALLSLPFISTLEYLLEHWRTWWISACSALMALALLYSFHLQLNVNALPFFTYFEVQSIFAQFDDDAVDHYFADRPSGIICGDILAAKKGQSFPPLARVASKLDPQSLHDLIRMINQWTRSNYYWWPG